MEQLDENPGRVLVVDDLPTNREIMARILARQGYDVSSAESGPEALDIIAENPPELVLLDVSMPGMNGFEVCERIKDDEATEHIPVIFVSALSELGDKVRAFEVGAVDYIIKPFRKDHLLSKIVKHTN